MGCWTYHNMWLLFIAGLQVGLLTALALDSTCNPSTEFSCRNDTSMCIPLSRVKDGTPDCPDKSDEECNKDEFQCQSIHQCIPMERYHDGWPDCDDGSDEECGREQFRCRCGVPHCIESSKVKDGTKDCEDGSDEVSGKNRNKTARCPDENRLQDLLAVEKKRRKRQIHSSGASFNKEDDWQLDETLLKLQPSVTESYSNNFQYSYTKFLNERLSRDRHNPHTEDDSDEEYFKNIHNFDSHDNQKSASPKSFMVKTETDAYGSLNSGKIYQTAVNELISVLPSAEYTVLKFDKAQTDKKYFFKPKNEKNQKVNDYEPKRFSDLIMKIAAIFQNESKLETEPVSRDEIYEGRYLKDKPTKSANKRKLLSVSDEEQETFEKNVDKAMLLKSDISHTPLEHSPTVPYMPQSDIHTTGIVMSTTGTDIIDGKTTEWTTIIEGTFISGTYAHIVHSTSKIYYTVDTPTPTMALDIKTTSEEESFLNSRKNKNINVDATSIEIHRTAVTDVLKETKYEKSSRSQRRNDKSLRALDDLISVLASPKFSAHFDIKPTASYSTSLDIVTVNDGSTTNIDVGTSTLLSTMELSLAEKKDFISPDPVEENLSLKSLDINEKLPLDISVENVTSENLFSNIDKISETISLEDIKNFALGDEGVLIATNKQSEMNVIGKMVGDLNSTAKNNAIESFSLNNNSNILSSLIDLEIKSILPTSTITHESGEPKNTVLEIKTSESKNINLTDEFESRFSNSEVLSSSILIEETSLSSSLSSHQSETVSHMETSLRIPDVTDLFVAFIPVSKENNTSKHVSVTDEKSNSMTLENEKVNPTSAISVLRTVENEQKSSTSDSNLLILLSDISVTKIISESTPSAIELPTDKSDVSIFDNNPIVSSLQERTKSSSTEESLQTLDTRSTEDKTLLKTDESEVFVSDLTPVDTSSVKESEVMVFLGIASTVNVEEISPSKTSSVLTLNSDENISTSAKLEETISTSSQISNYETKTLNEESFMDVDISKKELNKNSAMTVLLLPSMKLDDLKNLMDPTLSVSIAKSSSELTMSGTFIETNSIAITPALSDSDLIEKSLTKDSERDENNEKSTTEFVMSANEESNSRAKRAISESVTILRPEGRIVSTDARVYLTPTTLYTTYTYFTTILIPGGGSTVRSSLHVDSIVVEPTDRAVYGYDEHEQPCTECRIRATAVHTDYGTGYIGRPLSPDRYHIETVPYDVDRASEITHRTTYTYYTTRFRGGTPFIETRKETKTDVTPIPSVRYSPFEIGTYYDGDIDDYHYHTQPPHVEISRPHDLTHRTTYTYYTTRIRGGIATVETRKETDTNITPIPTYYRPGHVVTQPLYNVQPSYSQRIDPSLYKPDRVTHRTTYTYHTTRFRDGVPIVNTRKETETNVTPIPTYARPGYTQRDTAHRVVPSRPLTHYHDVTETYHPYVRQGTNPYATHRTTYTYFTTRLIGGSTHVDTRYVTETNITPNPTVPYIRGTTYSHPHRDDGYYETDCPVCREAQRTAVTRQIPHTIVRGRNPVIASRRSEVLNPEIKPSTATLFSTYTYATTQLTRGGRPVVRTREHTVTEILSDVVLPTLKFGDRIRSKRTVKPEEMAPKYTRYIDTVHVVPVRHTFSRTNSYADGRQGRRIEINDQRRTTPNRNNVQNNRTPHLRKIDDTNKKIDDPYRHRSQNSYKNNGIDIQPTSVTYFSTYTYFTTELQDGKPVVKTREHTVTEILTDVIVPTVSAVRRPHSLRATRTHEDVVHRPVRDVQNQNPDIFLPRRRLLGTSNNESDSSSVNEKEIQLQPSVLSYSDIHTKIANPNFLVSSVDLKHDSAVTPPLLNTNFEIREHRTPSLSLTKSNEFKITESYEDLTAAGAEVRRVVVATPVTHYTTYTYYATKIKPGGSRTIETSTRVSSSVIYPHSANAFDQTEYTRLPYNKKKLYSENSRTQSSVQAQPRRRQQSDLIQGVGSQAIRRFDSPYRRQLAEEHHRTCYNCNERLRGQQKPYNVHDLTDRVTKVQKNEHLRRVPVRNRNNVARRIFDRTQNNVYNTDFDIKPTHVTYYSTYTYFTTEPIDGSSVVRSREHTVTEILTNVIVPTVARLNTVHATKYDKHHYRSKRENSKDIFDTNESVEEVISVMKRKLLSLQDETTTLVPDLFNEHNSANYTVEGFIQNENTSVNESKIPETILVDSENINKSSLFEGNIFNSIRNITVEGTEESSSLNKSEILSNDTSRVFEGTEKHFESISKPFIYTTSSEFVDKISGSFTDSNFNTSVSNTTHEKFLDIFAENSEKISDIKLLGHENILTKPLNSSDEKDVVVTNTENISFNEDHNLESIEISLSELKTENKVIGSETLNMNQNFMTSESDLLKSSFLESTHFLGVTEPSFPQLFTEHFVTSSATPIIDKTAHSDYDYPIRSLSTSSDSYNSELSFRSEDLEAEGAELKRVVIATPTTHYTTYTYYSTILKPGGQSEIITNTKVAASTYYPDSPNHRVYDDDNLRYVRRPVNVQVSKPISHGLYSIKIHDLQRANAVARNQYLYPSRGFKPNRPSFTRGRDSQYTTVINHNSNYNRCLSCNKEYVNENNNLRHNRPIYHHSKSYLTSVPVRRMTDGYVRPSHTVPYTFNPPYTRRTEAARRIHVDNQKNFNVNKIPYEGPEIKPTHVTFYSTYTYFTTELQNGSPVVRSREHTVTEILTDVIVPTVTSLRTKATKYPSLRGKRDASNEADILGKPSNFPVQRKLLSIAESFSDDVDIVISETFKLPLSSQIENPSIEEDVSLKNYLVSSSFSSPTLKHSNSTPIEIDDNFLSNDKFSKAFAAYLTFLESSREKPQNVTMIDNEDIQKEFLATKSLIPLLDSQEITSDSPKTKPQPESKNMISVLTSDVKKNGRMTKYTTTIYGTYINGVYAQRALSTSDVIPVTEMNLPQPDTTLMFNPSRQSGLVRSIVSRKVRGPVAVHLTTEIHGTFVGGAYAQTARVFTSSQPLSSTREPSRHKLSTYSTTIPAGTRKTGLLSTRILRSKVDGFTTLLFVSEIYGTHIGGAYAHLGTYTTRTIVQTPAITSVDTEPTSTVLPTYYMEDLTTGLVTASTNEKSSNGITTRYHYQVYGTYLDGTYAHVPSISTETLTPRSIGTISPTLLMSTSLETTPLTDNKETIESTLSLSSTPVETVESKLGLIRASTRVNVSNGTTTQHIFEVYGTYLNGNYAHVPSLSVVTIKPSDSTQSFQPDEKTIDLESKSFETIKESIETRPEKNDSSVELNVHTRKSEIFEILDEIKNSETKIHSQSDSSTNIQTSTETFTTTKPDFSFEDEFEILTIFSDANIDETINMVSSNNDITIFPLELGPKNTIIPNENFDKGYEIINSRVITDEFSSPLVVSSKVPDSMHTLSDDHKQQTSTILPILLPEALRLSLSHDKANYRIRRNDPFSPYLRSSFTESIKSQRETQRSSLIATTPLPSSVFSELSNEFIENATKIHPSSNMFKKTFQTKFNGRFPEKVKSRSITSKSIMNSKAKLFYLKRSKRAAIRSTFGSSKRFGVSPTNSRTFGASNTFKRGLSSSSTRAFKSSNSKNLITPTKVASRTQSKSVPKVTSRTQSKSVPNFLARSQRSKPTLTYKTSTSLIKPTSSSDKYSLPSIRPRRFGKKENDNLSKMEEDFEASETVPQSVTEDKIRPTPTTSNRLQRPSKLSKFMNRQFSSSAASRSNKIISPRSSRRSRPQAKSTSSRNRVNDYRDYDTEIQPTSLVETTSSKRRFTLTTTFDISLKSTASYLSSIDMDEGNNLQEEKSTNRRGRNKSRDYNGNNRNRQGSSYKPVFDNDDNEVRADKPKSLPLPVFGRSRGLKRPPKFDPRTFKPVLPSSTSNIIYLTPSTNETSDIGSESEKGGPITVTNVFTTVKTLPVHLGPRTSFATITTTAFTTSTVQRDDLTFLTIGDVTKTLLSAITGLPDVNMPLEKQFTVVTEIILTTTEIESTSLVAIKVGFGTRTDTIVAKQKMTTLTTQTNTIFEEKTASPPFHQEYPYFQNPFAPPIPPQNKDFSLSLAENSFVSTQTVTSTTVLPLFFNGKTLLTTLTRTSLSEEILVKTTTFKVPQQPTMQPFIFPQPVFILPSVTTEITVKFTAHNGEIYSIVTLITVPLALNGHTRVARTVTENLINPTTSHTGIFNSKTNGFSTHTSETKIKDSFGGIILQSSFAADNLGPSNNEFTEYLSKTPVDNKKSTKLFSSILKKSKTKYNARTQTEKLKLFDLDDKNYKFNSDEKNPFKIRKLLQFSDDHDDANESFGEEYISTKDMNSPSGTQGSIPTEGYFTYIPDTFHLIGAGYNEEELSRPIPSVRVVPTRRAYVRRLKPSGSQNMPFDNSDEEFDLRRNNRNYPANVPRGSELAPVRTGIYRDDNLGFRRNVPMVNRPLVYQEGPVGNFGNLRNVHYFSPNRPIQPIEFEGDAFIPPGVQPNFAINRPNRPQDIPSNIGRNPGTFPLIRNNRPPQSEGYDALRNLPSYTPTRQNIPQVPPREDPTVNANRFEEEASRNQINRPQPAVTAAPRRVIRLRRPVNSQPVRSQNEKELLNRKPIVNVLSDEKESEVRGRGPVILTNSAIIRDSDDPKTNENESNEENDSQYTKPLPLTYYTTFTYMTTFLNGPSTAYSTREAVVSNIATETVNPRLVGLIRSRGGFTTPNGVQTAVPLGSRAQGATTTIVNLASRIQLYNSDVYHGRYSKLIGDSKDEEVTPTAENLRTIPITEVASLPKTYYTQFTYFYTLSDGDKSVHSQRSETISNVDTQTEPFVLQDFASTIDSSGFLTLKPDKQMVNLGLRTAGGTTTEVNLELKTVVHIDGLKNAVIDRGSITPTLVEVFPSDTNTVFNNYLDPDDAEVQDQQTYPQTVPIQPSFSSANEIYVGTQRSSSNKEATPEISSNSRIVRTQSVRGPVRVASTVLQRPGTLRSGVFAPRPGVRVRVRPVSSRVIPTDSSSLLSSEPDLSSYSIRFDPSRTISEEVTDFEDDETDVTEEDDSTDEYTTEETTSTEENENKRQPLPGRKRLKITIRRSPGVSASKTNSAIIRPTRTRPRFYVVTRTASPTGGIRPPKRPVSVKVSRRLRPSSEPEYETYTTMTSVPVVFGLSTTYRNAIVTSSSLVTSDASPDPSKTVVLTYFTTTTYTVPYTVDGIATYTTLEETNSRVATETLDPDDDLSFISSTVLDYTDEISASSADLMRHPPQTLKPQLVNNQLNVGPRVNLATKISNGVTLIVASDGENEATELLNQPTLTLRPTVVTDAMYMTNKDITTLYEPRTFYTTFTYFTTFFSGGQPSISTSEQVITNIYSVPVTHSITRTQPAVEPLTLIETSENLVSKTIYSTHTFYATLFNGTSTIVTPIEELQSSVIRSTETYTITKTIMPEIRATETLKPLTTTTSVYRTHTNFVTLFRGTESIVSPLEEIETDIVTLTLDNRIEPSRLPPKELYTTRTIQATNTHYITLFSGTESILSSITEVAPSVITELVKQLQEPTTTPFRMSTIQPSSVLSSSPSSSVEPIFQDLVPSIRTQYTTLTYFTTLFTDSSTILSSREEVATSYITLFVPAPAPGATNTGVSYTSKTDILTYGMSSKPSEIEGSSVTPTSEILTFYTTYTYYTTLFRGTETIISDSETVVTQYVTIESTPTDSASRHSTSLPPANSRPNYSASFEIKTMSSPTPAVSSPTFEKDFGTLTSNKEGSNDDIKILGVSTNIESNSEAPSIITGIPSTDANGATHILFTDFVVPSSVQDSRMLSTALFSEYVTPSLPELASSKYMVTKPSYTYDETTFFPHETSTPSSARDSAASDLATTRLTDVNVATHHMVLHPTTSYQSGSSQTMGIKPGAVIDLSDVLTNTNLVGNLGETIKDIVNLFAANGNRAGKNSTSKSSHSSSDSTVILPSGGVTVSSAEDPVFIPIGAIARSTNSRPAQANTEVPNLRPSTMLSGFTPIVSDDEKNTFDANNRKIDAVKSVGLASGTLTSIVFGSNTIFIQPSGTAPEIPATMLFSDMDGRFHSSFDDNILHGSESSQYGNHQKATPGMKPGDSTSLITGLETIFFGFPDARQPPQATTQLIQGSGSTSSVVGYETIFFDSPKDFYVPGSNQVNITGATTIFGTFPIHTDAGPSSDSTPESTFTTSSSGETTIFFPVPGDNQHQSPGTRYVTSVESVTLTLTLTTSSVYQTEDTPVTVTSVFTTTIPPRTFVSTIIGDRTILGTQPEPTEALQVIPTVQPSESTTTVTTTTLIFNSIATTVVRTLVIPTNAIQPTKPSTTAATDMVKLGGIGVDRPRVTTDRTTPRKPIQLFKSGNRPAEQTTAKPARTGPPLKLFPTKPPTTTTIKPPPRPVTTRKTSFRKPGKTLVPMTDGCPRECNLKNKEVCKQNLDKSWSCQCRPGFFRKNGTEECRDVKSFVVLVRVLKMGENDVTYSADLSNHLSPEYKNLTTTARKAVDDAYKTSSVGDDFVSTNVISVTRDRGVKPEGVLVNLTVQLTGEKPSNEFILKEELTNSLEAASSDISLSNASVSPIIQRVEDVQDFDECYDDSYNDCSRSAICINLPGTYTCECKEGYQDLETLLPGRICSGEIKDCDYCNNRGVCIMTEDDNKFCRCYRMYLGKQCEINGLVLAIALPIALALLILTMFCLLCGCRKLRQRRAQKPKPNVFKGMVPPMAGTLDRKAMIMDSSSESSGEHRPPAHQHHAYDGFSDDVANSTMKRSRRSESLDDHISSEFQMPTVLIPRAKHSHPKQVNAPYPNYRMPHGDMDRW